MVKATEIQVGGSYYKTMAIQPLELGYANQYEACIYSAIKYVSRHRVKDGAEGLKKADHCVRFAHEMLKIYGPRACLNRIPMDQFIRFNRFEGLEASILTDLHQWGLKMPENPDAAANLIVSKIQALIRTAYEADTNV